MLVEGERQKVAAAVKGICRRLGIPARDDVKMIELVHCGSSER